jgi:hypothetical protein
MRGRYHMMDWERTKWTQELTYILHKLEKGEREISLTHYDLCPQNVIDILESIGWEYHDYYTDNEYNCMTFYKENAMKLYLTYNADLFSMSIGVCED